MIRDAYSRAFYVQAQSDWVVYRMFAGNSDVRSCHALHYLQMSCEKLAKAYRLRDPKLSTLKDLTSGHTGFVSFVNAFLRSPGVVADYKGKAEAHQALCKNVAKFAREVERLAPRLAGVLDCAVERRSGARVPTGPLEKATLSEERAKRRERLEAGRTSKAAPIDPRTKNGAPKKEKALKELRN